MSTGFPVKCPIISCRSLRWDLRAQKEAKHNDEVKLIFYGVVALIKFLTLRRRYGSLKRLFEMSASLLLAELIG